MLSLHYGCLVDQKMHHKSIVYTLRLWKYNKLPQLQGHSVEANFQNLLIILASCKTKMPRDLQNEKKEVAGQKIWQD